GPDDQRGRIGEGAAGVGGPGGVAVGEGHARVVAVPASLLHAGERVGPRLGRGDAGDVEPGVDPEAEQLVAVGDGVGQVRRRGHGAIDGTSGRPPGPWRGAPGGGAGGCSGVAPAVPQLGHEAPALEGPQGPDLRQVDHDHRRALVVDQPGDHAVLAGRRPLEHALGAVDAEHVVVAVALLGPVVLVLVLVLVPVLVLVLSLPVHAHSIPGGCGTVRGHGPRTALSGAGRAGTAWRRGRWRPAPGPRRARDGRWRRPP